MADLILELYTEEIPARMQKNAEEEYKQIFTKKFSEAEIVFTQLEMHVGPRRLVLYVSGLPTVMPARNIELKGPRVGSPEAAIEGFCKSNNIDKSDLSTALFKDQECYVFKQEILASPLEKTLSKILPEAIGEYTWQKSMKWSDFDIRWVRPLLNLMCIFDGKVLDMNYGHLKANDISFGHRFIANNPFTVSNWEDYKTWLNNAHVTLSREERLELIKAGISKIEENNNITVDKDAKLLDEVAGIAESVSVLIGKIPEKFMLLPSEILITAMKTHQRYFPVRTLGGEFAPYFVFVSNLPAKDKEEIIRGNEKVLSARLADAAYFYSQDKKIPLEARISMLKNVVFHAKLGTMYAKVERLVKLAAYLKPKDEMLAKAALLCKADLVTEAVGEFPDLQGIMGSYYVLAEGLPVDVACAIKDHYKPLGNNDEAPSGYAAYLALVDKMDSLVGLMLAGERATGSKDPYALRRYALGIIKIILANKISGIDILEFIEFTEKLYDYQLGSSKTILEFIEDRLKHYLKEEYDQNLVNSVASLSTNGDMSTIIQKLDILKEFLASSGGEAVLQIYHRVISILDKSSDAEIDEKKLKLPEEISLYEVFKSVATKINTTDFLGSLNHLTLLKTPVDQFFDNIMVNDPDAAIANNRKALLQVIVNLFHKVADFKYL